MWPGWMIKSHWTKQVVPGFVSFSSPCRSNVLHGWQLTWIHTRTQSLSMRQFFRNGSIKGAVDSFRNMFVPNTRLVHWIIQRMIRLYPHCSTCVIRTIYSRIFEELLGVVCLNDSVACEASFSTANIAVEITWFQSCWTYRIKMIPKLQLEELPVSFLLNTIRSVSSILLEIWDF